MGYRIIAQGGSLAYGVKYYQCDRIEDLALLPKDTPGCKAYIVNTKKEFTLGNSNSWTETTDTNDIEDLRRQINNLQVNAYKFKGSVANFEALSEISHPEEGDVYNTLDNGMNYGYTGTNWDALGQLIDLDLLATKQELSNEVTAINTELDKKYIKPDGGIPESHLHNSVQLKLVQSGFSLPAKLLPGELFLKFDNNDNIPRLYTGKPGNLNNPFQLNQQLPMVTRNTDGYLASGQYAQVLDGLSKLSTIDENAQVNKIESISLNGTTQTIDNNKNVNITIPIDLGDFTNNAGYIKSNALPTKVSDLTNDSHFITANDIPTIPSKLGDLTDDVGYAKTSDLPTDLGDLTNNAGYALTANIPTVPTNISAFTNDAGYAKTSELPTIPTNVSAFNNDAGYITGSSLPGAANNNTAGIIKLFTGLGQATDGTMTQKSTSNSLFNTISNFYKVLFTGDYCKLDASKSGASTLSMNGITSFQYFSVVEFDITFLNFTSDIALFGFNLFSKNNDQNNNQIYLAYGKYYDYVGLMCWNEHFTTNNPASNPAAYIPCPIDNNMHTIKLWAFPDEFYLQIDNNNEYKLSLTDVAKYDASPIVLYPRGINGLISRMKWDFSNAAIVQEKIGNNSMGLSDCIVDGTTFPNTGFSITDNNYSAITNGLL